MRIEDIDRILEEKEDLEVFDDHVNLGFHFIYHEQFEEAIKNPQKYLDTLRHRCAADTHRAFKNCEHHPSRPNLSRNYAHTLGDCLSDRPLTKDRAVLFAMVANHLSHRPFLCLRHHLL